MYTQPQSEEMLTMLITEEMYDHDQRMKNYQMQDKTFEDLTTFSNIIGLNIIMNVHFLHTYLSLCLLLPAHTAKTRHSEGL